MRTLPPNRPSHRRLAEAIRRGRRKRPVAGVLALAALLASASVLAAPAAEANGNGHGHGNGNGNGNGRGNGAAPGSQTSLALSWYDITNQTIDSAGFPEPVTGSDIWSIGWLAAARAIGRSPDGPYAEAALVQALHDTLVAEVPAQQAGLDSDLASSLAGIPNGNAKSAGIAAGKQQAAAVLAARQNDGLDTASLDIPYTPPPAGPGVWQPTPPSYGPAVRAGEGKGKAYLLAANDQFDPGPPPSLSSSEYRQGLAEVRAYGAQSSTVRSAEQTDVAAFWEPAANIQYIQIVRGLISEEQRQLAWDAKFVAAFQVVTTDAQIGIYNAKFQYAFWRPVTAIQEDPVDPDPSWTPYFTTPRYPDWPSGHGGYAGASQAVLSAFVGPHAPSPVAVSSPTDPGSTHEYSGWQSLTAEVVDARVWEGIHFRFSDEAGAVLGQRVGEYDLRHLSSIGL